MPVVLTQPGVIEIVLNFKLFNIPIKIVIGVRIGTTVPSVGVISNMLDAVNGWVDPTLLQYLSVDLKYLGCYGYDASSASGVRVDKPLVAPAQGGINVASLPPQNACVTTFATGLRGRSYRGRAYVAGIPTSVETSAILDASFAGNIAAAWGALHDVIDAQGGEMVIISRYAAKAPRPIAVATQVNTFIGRQPIGTQRRRSTMTKQRA